MRVRFRGYWSETLPSGTVRHLVRIEGQPKRKIRIPVGPDDPAFSEHYHAARAGQRLEAKTAPEPAPLTLDALIADYLRHAEMATAAGRMNPATLRHKRSLLTRAADVLSPEGTRMGSLHRDLPPEAIEHIRDAWGARTGAADNLLKALRVVYDHARLPNPARAVRRVHISRGGATPWTAADVRKFADRHPPGTMPHLWLTLALWTGARIGDLAILGRRHETRRDGALWLEWQPGKKGSARVSLPMAPALHAATRAMVVQGPTYLLNAHGRPFASEAVLGNSVRDWTTQAGLTGRSSHGLRKALAELLAEAGCSEHEIMAIMAHSQPMTSAVYTKGARRARLAQEAMARIAGRSLL